MLAISLVFTVYVSKEISANAEIKNAVKVKEVKSFLQRLVS